MGRMTSMGARIRKCEKTSLEMFVLTPCSVRTCQHPLQNKHNIFAVQTRVLGRAE
jgi:hypothetical protein